MSGAPSQDEVLGYFDSLSNWGRWGPDDELGTLNLVGPAKRREAAGLVEEGVSVSCAWDVDTATSPDQVFGAPQRFMLATGEGLADPDRVLPAGTTRPARHAGAAEYLGLAFHGYSVTHLDGLSHYFWDGRMYNGRPAAAVTAAAGATAHAVTAARHGIVSRGVLLDVAAARGGRWLEPGEAAFPADLEAAESRQDVQVGEGDVVLLRTGYGAKRRERGPDAPGAVGRAGWHAACLPWLHRRGVAAIGADTAQDVHPSGYDELRSPVHAVGIVAMGLWLLDNCDLEDLAATCARLGRNEFHFAVAPLRVVGGTGSPVNPIATF